MNSWVCAGVAFLKADGGVGIEEAFDVAEAGVDGVC